MQYKLDPDSQYVLELQMPTGRAFHLGPYSGPKIENMRAKALECLEYNRPWHFHDAENRADMTFLMQHFCSLTVMRVVEKPQEEQQRPALIKGDEVQELLSKMKPGRVN